MLSSDIRTADVLTLKARLAALLYEKSYMEGDFTLSSGRKSDYYFDCRQSSLNPEGAWLIGMDGSRYLDAVSSWWTNLHGHAEPRIAAAIAQQATQLEQVILAGFSHAPAVELAERHVAAGAPVDKGFEPRGQFCPAPLDADQRQAAAGVVVFDDFEGQPLQGAAHFACGHDFFLFCHGSPHVAFPAHTAKPPGLAMSGASAQPVI